MFQPSVLIIVALISFFTGFSAGLLVAALRYEKSSTTEPSASPAEVLPSQAEPAVANPVSAASPAAPTAISRANPPAAPVSSVAIPPPASVETIQAPSMNPIDVISRAIRPSVSSAGPMLSIAAQIDEILQEKLASRPELVKRAIRLLELPGKGMVVMVGLEQYDGIDSVPDAEIRDLIRSAVAEWEKR